MGCLLNNVLEIAADVEFWAMDFFALIDAISTISKSSKHAPTT
jgi:hypothetical protein